MVKEPVPGSNSDEARYRYSGLWSWRDTSAEYSLLEYDNVVIDVCFEPCETAVNCQQPKL